MSDRLDKPQDGLPKVANNQAMASVLVKYAISHYLGCICPHMQSMVRIASCSSQLGK